MWRHVHVFFSLNLEVFNFVTFLMIRWLDDVVESDDDEKVIRQLVEFQLDFSKIILHFSFIKTMLVGFSG